MIVNSQTFIGMGVLLDDYKVEFHKKNELVEAKLFHREVQVNQCNLEGLAITSWWAYITIPAFARLKVDQMRIGHMKQIDPSDVIVQHYGKDKRVPYNNGPGSDDDEIVDKPIPLTVFSRTITLSPISMTVPCHNKNVKGSTLIELAHDSVLNLYYGLIQKHGVEKATDVFIKDSLGWFRALGNWKSLMPTAEVQSIEKIKSVKIFEKNREFIITNDRICLPLGFSISNKQGVAWRLLGASDLSYSRIIDVIECIKKVYNVRDEEIAKWQLNALSRTEEIKLPNSVLCFLDYLNGLMFGIEASGLNAALATGLMTLDLIAMNKLSYKLSFYANNEGGIYPYACFGNNKGTYSKREDLLYHNRRACELSIPHSMKELRKNPSLSPVALKEAIIIKEWLKQHKILCPNILYNKQIDNIRYAINDLLYYYFFPESERMYSVKEFSKNKGLAHQ